jgi:hypothetical protein
MIDTIVGVLKKSRQAGIENHPDCPADAADNRRSGIMNQFRREAMLMPGIASAM